MWLMEEVTTNMGRDQKALRNLRLISPSGMAIKKVMNKTAKSATLYNAAFAFLYPSLRESFGIPILEAMACGTPVVTGNVSAMPEVAGKGAILVDPQEPQKIADALLRLENDATLYQQQVNYSLERVKLFSWKHTAEEYVKIYHCIHQ